MAKKATKVKGGKAEADAEVLPVTPAPTGSLLHPVYSFDILGQKESITERTQAILSSMRKSKRVTSLKSMAEIRQSMIPLRHFMMQQVLGTFGLPQSCLVEIIGAEALGKTTLAMQLGAWGMLSGCPLLYVECEGKPMPMARAMRMMSTDKAKAAHMVSRVQWTSARALPELNDVITNWVGVMRGNIQGAVENKRKDSINVPRDTPLIVIVDPFSKLMSKAEAVGYYAYDDYMDPAVAKKYKEIGEGSNFGHASFAHQWSRRLPLFLTANNVMLIMIHHQNTKIEMGGGGFGATFMPQETSDLYNKVHIGGKALNQNAAVQFILARRGLVKNPDNSPRGTKVRLRVDKNSYGPSNRIIEYELRNESFGFDTDTYLDPALHFDEDLAKFFADNRYLNTKVDSRLYSCEELGLTGVTGAEFSAAFHANEAVVNRMGKQLAIEGYFDIMDFLKEGDTNAPAPADTQAQ